MKIDKTIKPNLELDTKGLISDKDCPASGQIIGDHFFKTLESNVLCNCTIALIISVQLPIIYLKVKNLTVRVDLSTQ